MWPTLRSWTRSLSHNAHRQTAARRRLTLEVLEDRCVPSTAGSLDPTFGNGAGYVTTSTSAYQDGARAGALIQPNGQIIAVGNAVMSTGEDFGVERYNTNGSLDTSFGSGGIALASFGSLDAIGTSSALYPAGSANAGKIVEEGTYNKQDQILARFNTNGTLDTTFGTGGKVMTAFPGVGFVAAPEGGVVVTSTGQIVAFSDDWYADEFVLARYNANGTLDTTFGHGGYVITPINGSENSAIPTLLQQPDGTLIVTYGQNTSAGNVWLLYGFNANGTPDTSFGNQGIVTTTAPGGPSVAALYFNAEPSNDGQIVIMGGPGDDLTQELARYNANGSLDTTFGTGGFAQTQINWGSAIPDQAAIDTNGRFVVTGVDGSAAAVARFNVDGTLDATFGTGGLVTTTAGTASLGMGVAIYPNAGAATDGDIVVAGASNNGTKYNVLVARYLGQATGPNFTIIGSANVTAGTATTYTISVLNPDGSADTGYNGTVHFTSSDPQAVLPGNVAITGGTGTFNATLATAGTQSITATDTTTGSISGVDAGITVSPAAASQVVFTTQPAGGTAGQTLGTVQATLKDAYGNVETADNNDSVTLSVNSGPSTQMGGTLTATATAGVASFSNLLLNTSGTYTLAALVNLTGVGTLGPVVSTSFAVASPVSLAFGGLTYNSKTKLYSETVTLTNTTGGTLTGPMSVELTNLPSGVVLTDATGTTKGDPYIDFLASGKTLKKSASVSITLTFSDPSQVSILFGTEVVVGL